MVEGEGEMEVEGGEGGEGGGGGWRKGRDPCAANFSARACLICRRTRIFVVEFCCAGKHTTLCRRCRRSSPRRDVVVERRSGIKHIIHIIYFLCVPTPNVVVERRSGRQTYHSHISHLRCVPTPNVVV